MNEKTEMQKVSEETMRFMRGKYALDEVPGKYYDIDCLKFRQGKRTILSINIHEDHYDFQIIYGKAEREKFEARRGEFPNEIQVLYDEAHTYHDGKWMLVRVDNLATLDVVKQMILIKKNPNRKPFPKDQAVYSDCGHRCDLCVHFSGGTITDEFRDDLKKRLKRIYEPDNEGESEYFDGDIKLCPGCGKGGYAGEADPCRQKRCAMDKGVPRCMECGEYKSCSPQVGYNQGIEIRSMSADDVTWAILPYVEDQYGN